jgi:hypothetical protein
MVRIAERFLLTETRSGPSPRVLQGHPPSQRIDLDQLEAVIDDECSVHPLDVLDNVLANIGTNGVKKPLHVEACEASLANRAEFAVMRRAWWHANNVDLLDQLRGRIDGLGGLTGSLLVVGVTETGEVQEVPMEVDRWEPGDPFLLFQERFKTALVKAGAPLPFAHGVVGALNEMASNAIEHAQAPAPPVSTFEVLPDRWGFSVTDIGIGLLASLKNNPAYQALKNDVTALQAAVKDGVSATSRAGRGFGFTQVFRSLADRACRIRFRTTGALATWEGVSPAAQHLKMSPMPQRAGFHVAVSGSLPKIRA